MFAVYLQFQIDISNLQLRNKAWTVSFDSAKEYMNLKQLLCSTKPAIAELSTRQVDVVAFREGLSRKRNVFWTEKMPPVQFYSRKCPEQTLAYQIFKTDLENDWKLLVKVLREQLQLRRLKMKSSDLYKMLDALRCM
ncbi:hypothetical protein BDF20DRAFT_838045 [Mycotypha africana]|uniref:uncharacterized protein n=1 Tax=Mycotypha africana TaxID=64632 RepID=UPI0023001A0E|nr:uncharacterized protein BDF20DRAFT_838045 [Mycotypha africana]KAI8971744.1 hypothetical protein BDF20DRAFT_838045 [Mycotypha africana]